MNARRARPSLATYTARGEVPPVAVECEGQERAGRQLLRLDTCLERRLEVEGTLFEREVGLEDLFVERELNVAAQRQRDLIEVGDRFRKLQQTRQALVVGNAHASKRYVIFLI